MKLLKTIALAGLLSVGVLSTAICEDLNIQQQPKKIDVPVGPDRLSSATALYPDPNNIGFASPQYSFWILTKDNWLLNSVMREMLASSKPTSPPHTSQ